MQLLRIDPPREIQFSGTNFADTTHVTHLTLTNASTTSNVAFKVKTTALKSYLVRPSQNVLKVGETVQIQILLQRLQEVPANHRHRFLVQAAPTSEDTLSSREAWPQIVKDAQVSQDEASRCLGVLY
ncbi:unnamed protein product [Amoebophrya sp. A120]|nr:unnamed protein product [Amoebophrya sp. A120]|eukprot:GSA120T00000114001.1